MATVHFRPDWSAGTAGRCGERANLARTSFLALLAKVMCKNRPNERLGVQERFERAREGPLRARSRRTCTPESSFEPNLHVTFRKTGSKLVRAKVARRGPHVRRRRARGAAPTRANLARRGLHARRRGFLQTVLLATWIWTRSSENDLPLEARTTGGAAATHPLHPELGDDDSETVTISPQLPAIAEAQKGAPHGEPWLDLNLGGGLELKKRCAWRTRLLVVWKAFVRTGFKTDDKTGHETDLDRL